MRDNNFTVQTSEAKVMVGVFWNSEGILLVEFWEGRAAISSERKFINLGILNNTFEGFC
jgi:hypothetical protein